MSPLDLNWKPAPLPDAECCHPDSRIIYWSPMDDLSFVELTILKPEDYYWTNEKGNRAYINNFIDMHGAYWAWWKSFHPLKESK